MARQSDTIVNRLNLLLHCRSLMGISRLSNNGTPVDLTSALFLKLAPMKAISKRCPRRCGESPWLIAVKCSIPGVDSNELALCSVRL